MSKETPLMKQYNSIKAKYPDAVLLFRVGDFYETFSQDAIIASKVLGIVLTKRANGSASHIELAGFPHHSLDAYLPKLVKAGYRVAICDQLEDPKLTKTIVKRGVTELVTPGVTYNDKILNQQRNNFLCAIAFPNGFSPEKLTHHEIGISFLDISTGEFLLAQGNWSHIEKLLQSFRPAEVIYSKAFKDFGQQKLSGGHYTFLLEDWVCQLDYTRDLMLRHFQTQSLKGFGVDELTQGIIAAGAVLHYLKETEHNDIKHIATISRIAEDKYVWLDKFTARNLELIDTPHRDGVALIDILDRTVSPMGARLLRRWLMLPLKEIDGITQRQEVVAHFMQHEEQTLDIIQQLKQVGDLERLISKVPLGRINPREVVHLKRALMAVQQVKDACKPVNQRSVQQITDKLDPCATLVEILELTMMEDAPMLINKGNVIKNGVNLELDDLRAISTSSKDYLLQMQTKASEETGISSLKVGFNNVFGYYLEVTNVHKSKVPAEWVRKQTLTNAERYITDELKHFEEKILGAEEKIQAIETRLYNDLVLKMGDYVATIQRNAHLLAQLDCLLCFAQVAKENNYVQPSLTNDGRLEIKEGRHPVIEKQLPIGESYVPNDVHLDQEKQQIIIITGPNMAGKSALLRQTALIVLLAQIGSFVPASAASISIVDKIFTRVGASDNISSGESTFMVEMNETASILNNLSNDSLILLDEIGRGTSTYDGISIAWSIVEYLHNYSGAKAKTLFATHYHELTELADSYPRIKNFNVSVREADNKIIFLRKLKEGGSQHSFGIQVAKMAGMPTGLINRANEIMHQLEAKSINEQTRQSLQQLPPQMQLSIFDSSVQKNKALEEAITNIDINTLTPVEALMKLAEMKKILKEN
jgi:DNA mismatch repair protein MutS